MILILRALAWLFPAFKPPTPPSIPLTEKGGLAEHPEASGGVCEFSITDWLSERT